MVNAFSLQPLLFTFAPFLSDNTNFSLLSQMAQDKHKSHSLENYFSVSSFQIAPDTRSVGQVLESISDPLIIVIIYPLNYLCTQRPQMRTAPTTHHTKILTLGLSPYTEEHKVKMKNEMHEQVRQ